MKKIIKAIETFLQNIGKADLYLEKKEGLYFGSCLFCLRASIILVAIGLSIGLLLSFLEFTKITVVAVLCFLFYMTILGYKESK